MNSAKLRSKRIVLPAIAVAVALGIGGVVWATTASADDVSGSERDRVSSAALDATGGGKVTSAETSDDPGEAYEVEVRKDDGTEVDVTLDQDLKVVGQDADDRDDSRDDTGDDNDTDVNDTRDADDRVLSAAERTSAEKAAKAAVGGGTVTDVDASDDPGTAYDVEVTKADGTEWNVDLDTDFAVVDKSIDR